MRNIWGTDEVIGIGALDLGKLSSADIDALGDRVFGHAVRRVLKAKGSEGLPEADEPIAGHQDSP